MPSSVISHLLFELGFGTLTNRQTFFLTECWR